MAVVRDDVNEKYILCFTGLLICCTTK